MGTHGARKKTTSNHQKKQVEALTTRNPPTILSPANKKPTGPSSQRWPSLRSSRPPWPGRSVRLFETAIRRAPLPPPAVVVARRRSPRRRRSSRPQTKNQTKTALASAQFAQQPLAAGYAVDPSTAAAYPTAAADAPNVSGAYPSVYAALQGEGLTDFQALADRGRLSPLLKNASIPATVFVPSNQAVAQALSDMKMDAQAIASNNSVITDIVFYHIVPGRVFSEGDLQQMGSMGGNGAGGASVLPTMRGKDLLLSTSPNTGAVEVIGGTEARLVPGRTNIRAGNSTIHVVDYLLLPEDTRDEAGLKTRAVAKRFRTVAEALTQVPQFSSTARAAGGDPSLVNVLSNPQLVATVFAPNNAAWTKLARSNSPLLNNSTMLRDTVAYSVATNRALSQDELRALGTGSTLSTLSGAPLIVGQMSTAAEQALVQTGDVRPMAQEAGELMAGMPMGSAALMMSSDSGVQSVGVVGEPFVAGRAMVHEVDGVLMPKAVAQQVGAIEQARAKAAEAAKAAAAQAAALAAQANATKANGASGLVAASAAALAAPAVAVFAALL
jgi:uncharacterized surface protein with fasciclin (FAS1) repeats